jgi:iron complex outermembrane receptor protein
MADLIGQGIAGTVDLRTIRPLEYGKQVTGRPRHLHRQGQAEHSNEYGWRVNGIYVDQFADGKVGVALAASYADDLPARIGGGQGLPDG